MTLPFRPSFLRLTNFYDTIELANFSESAFPRVDTNLWSKRAGVDLKMPCLKSEHLSHMANDELDFGKFVEESAVE